MSQPGKQHVLVSGGSGLIGSSAVTALGSEGHRITRLVRPGRSGGRAASPEAVTWDEESLPVFLAKSPVDTVLHLAGAPIFRLWTEAHKKLIRESRVLGTQRLAATLASVEPKPKLLICASAIGLYGNRGSELLTEESPSGTGFLAETCVEWEAAAQPARHAGIRVVNLRIGIVLARAGGALRTMLPSFKLGLGARLGSGQQWMSWIVLEDLLAAIQFVMADENIGGALNAVAPNAVTNADFTSTLAKVLSRPSFLSVPEFVLRMAPGKMGKEALLASARVVPRKLMDSGFSFKHAQLEEALESVLAAIPTHAQNAR